MKAKLVKYQHYLFILVALLVANYILLPLIEFQEEQQQTFALLDKQQRKTKQLLTNTSELSAINAKLDSILIDSERYLFKQKNIATLKLDAQAKVEEILKLAGCTIQRIGFKGNQQLSSHIQKWFIEIRYKGDISCLTNTTRALESALPYINIEYYNYNNRNFDTKAQGDFNAVLNVSIWHKQVKEVKA